MSTKDERSTERADAALADTPVVGGAPEAALPGPAEPSLPEPVAPASSPNGPRRRRGAIWAVGSRRWSPSWRRRSGRRG